MLSIKAVNLSSFSNDFPSKELADYTLTSQNICAKILFPLINFGAESLAGRSVNFAESLYPLNTDAEVEGNFSDNK
jgi:hypothetical protein